MLWVEIGGLCFPQKRIWPYRRHDAELVEAPGHGHTHVLAAAPD